MTRMRDHLVGSRPKSVRAAHVMLWYLQTRVCHATERSYTTLHLASGDSGAPASRTTRARISTGPAGQMNLGLFC